MSVAAIRRQQGWKRVREASGIRQAHFAEQWPVLCIVINHSIFHKMSGCYGGWNGTPEPPFLPHYKAAMSSDRGVVLPRDLRLSQRSVKHAPAQPVRLSG